MVLRLVFYLGGKCLNFVFYWKKIKWIKDLNVNKIGFEEKLGFISKGEEDFLGIIVEVR